MRYEVTIDLGVGKVIADEPIVADYRWLLVFELQTCTHGFLDGLETVDGAYVDGLANVPALGETSVVGPEESENVLFGALVGFVDFDAVGHEFQGVNHKSDAVEELPLACLLEDVGVKEFLVRLGNHIPGLDGPLVTVVEGV